MRYNNDNKNFRCYDVTGSGEILDANTCLIFFFAVSSSQVKTDAKYVFSSCGTQRSSGIWPSRKKRSLMENGSFGFFANNNLTESHLAMLSVRNKRQVTTTTASTSATTTAVTTTILTTTTTTITTTTTYSMAAHETMREVTCVNWHSAADNYWKWEQEVPEHCYRKHSKIKNCLSPFFFERVIFPFASC